MIHLKAWSMKNISSNIIFKSKIIKMIFLFGCQLLLFWFLTWFLFEFKFNLFFFSFRIGRSIINFFSIFIIFSYLFLFIINIWFVITALTSFFNCIHVIRILLSRSLSFEFACIDFLLGFWFRSRSFFNNCMPFLQ